LCHCHLSPTPKPSVQYLSSNCDLDLDAGLNVDDDLLDNLGWGVEIDQSLVDSHLKGIPGLGAFTARGLSGGNLQGLGGKSDGSLRAEFLGLGALDELLAHLLKGGNLAAGQGNTDLVGFWALAELSLLWLLERHDCGWMSWLVLLHDSNDSVTAK